MVAVRCGVEARGDVVSELSPVAAAALRALKDGRELRVLDRLVFNQLTEMYYGVSWPRIARRARARAKYNCTRYPTTPAAMHANIISLERTPERAKELCSTLDTGGMPFTMFAAQDSLEAIPQLLLYWYVSPTNTSRSAQ